MLELFGQDRFTLSQSQISRVVGYHKIATHGHVNTSYRMQYRITAVSALMNRQKGGKSE